MTEQGETGATAADATVSPAAGQGIPAGIWALGFVSMLMDISSEMIHSLLPVYLVGVLGASTFTVGIIEGIAEATASITKVFSGAISDWFGKRKFLAALGYGLAAATKPIFPLAGSIDWLIAARFVDRVGKGIRGAPRDALVADLAPPHLRGASFGLRQSLDTVGAFVGPLLAIGLMWLTADHFQAVFWIAAVPALLSVGVMVFAVKEPERPSGLRRVRMPLHRMELRRLGIDRHALRPNGSGHDPCPRAGVARLRRPRPGFRSRRPRHRYRRGPVGIAHGIHPGATCEADR